MHFSVFFPPTSKPAPVLWFLAGLTSNDQNFVQKAGAQRLAAQHGIALVAPDTSPRGLGIPGEDTNGWDFGVGAGMYVDAVNPPWEKGYKMYSYVTKDLPALLVANFPQLDMSRQAISGHSMGGHGALLCALKNPGHYKSVSAFAPICNASAVPWGNKTFSAYLGPESALWKEYDACELATKYKGPYIPVLVHQGDKDKFLANQLSTPKFEAVLKGNPVFSESTPPKIVMCPGYDHGYYFISSFVDEHVAFHAAHLNKA
jgi:S-formylglutathione hydrolase